MSSEIDRALEGNRLHGPRLAAPDLSPRPARRLAILACMDARVLPQEALGMNVGDVHVLRNAGGIVTDDVIRSLVLSQHALGTEEVMVMQHTRCGLEGLDEEAFAASVEERTGSRPPALGSFDDVARSVATSIRRLRREPLLAGQVRGFVYVVETGLLTEVEV